MAGARTCPQCGGEMPGGVLEGLCPNCLGKVTCGLDSKGEPVVTGLPTARYGLKRPGRRGERAGAVWLAAAAVVSLGLALWANRERERAREAKAEAQAVLAFFENKVLAAARPEGHEGGLGREVTIRAAIEAAEPTISGSFSNQPPVEASIRTALGLTYHYLGDYSNSVRQLERSRAIRQAMFGPEHPETLASMNNLAVAYLAAGQHSKAVALAERAFNLMKAKVGPAHPDTLTSRNNLASAYLAAKEFPKAEPLLLEAYATLQQGDQAAPGMKRQVLEGLCRLYVGWAVAEPGTGKIQKGHEWQKKLAELDRIPSEGTHPGSGDQRR